MIHRLNNNDENDNDISLAAVAVLAANGNGVGNGVGDHNVQQEQQQRLLRRRRRDEIDNDDDGDGNDEDGDDGDVDDALRGLWDVSDGDDGSGNRNRNGDDDDDDDDDEDDEDDEDDDNDNDNADIDVVNTDSVEFDFGDDEGDDDDEKEDKHNDKHNDNDNDDGEYSKARDASSSTPTTPTTTTTTTTPTMTTMTMVNAAAVAREVDNGTATASETGRAENASSSTARTTATMTTPALSTTTQAPYPLSSTSWRSAPGDMEARSEMVRTIANILISRKRSGGRIPPPEWTTFILPHKSRRLEERLYLEATSYEAYVDRSTLKLRLEKLANAIVARHVERKRRRDSGMVTSTSMMATNTNVTTKKENVNGSYGFSCDHKVVGIALDGGTAADAPYSVTPAHSHTFDGMSSGGSTGDSNNDDAGFFGEMPGMGIGRGTAAAAAAAAAVGGQGNTGFFANAPGNVGNASCNLRGGSNSYNGANGASLLRDEILRNIREQKRRLLLLEQRQQRRRGGQEMGMSRAEERSQDENQGQVQRQQQQQQQRNYDLQLQGQRQDVGTFFFPASNPHRPLGEKEEKGGGDVVVGGGARGSRQGKLLFNGDREEEEEEEEEIDVGSSAGADSMITPFHTQDARRTLRSLSSSSSSSLTFFTLSSQLGMNSDKAGLATAEDEDDAAAAAVAAAETHRRMSFLSGPLSVPLNCVGGGGGRVGGVGGAGGNGRDDDYMRSSTGTLDQRSESPLIVPETFDW